MKTLFLMSLALLLSAHAQAIESAPPARYAHFKGTITKSIIDQRVPRLTNEKVCDVAYDIPLYETKGSWGLVNSKDCQSTVKGKPVKIYVSAFMGMRTSDEGLVTKNGTAILNVNSPTQEFFSAQTGQAGSDAVDAKTLTLGILSATYGKGNVQEAFSLSATFEDVNQ